MYKIGEYTIDGQKVRIYSGKIEGLRYLSVHADEWQRNLSYIFLLNSETLNDYIWTEEYGDRYKIGGSYAGITDFIGNKIYITVTAFLP